MFQFGNLARAALWTGFVCLGYWATNKAEAADFFHGLKSGVSARIKLNGGAKGNAGSITRQDQILLAQSTIAPPQGPVLLTISGAITNTNGEGVAKLDREMLLSLGLHELKTTTSWTDGVKTFRGVLASDVMEYVGVYGTKVTATALNDYVVEIPVSDFEKYGVVFALWMDGEQLTRRNKGPIWPVYPRDDFPELMNRSSDKKWIWQLVTMEIR